MRRLLEILFWGDEFYLPPGWFAVALIGVGVFVIILEIFCP